MRKTVVRECLLPNGSNKEKYGGQHLKSEDIHRVNFTRFTKNPCDTPLQAQSQNRKQTRKVNFLTDMDFAQICETHERHCYTPPQPTSKNRLENRKNFLIYIYFCEDPSVTGLQRYPKKSIHDRGKIATIAGLTKIG